LREIKEIVAQVYVTWFRHCKDSRGLGRVVCWRTCGKEASYSWVEYNVIKRIPRFRSLQKGKTYFSFFCGESFQRQTKCVVSTHRLHSEGWLLDVFRRIHGEEGTFFVPLDLEISSQELSYIMKRAEQWRGTNGERRMVSGEQSLQKESLTHWSKLTLNVPGYYLKGPRCTRKLFMGCFFEWRS